MPARPRPPEPLLPPLPLGTKYTDIMRPFHRDCQQAHTSTPLKPQYRCLAQTRETQRTSTGRDNPALSSTAAVLSFCRHLTFPFAPTPLPCTPLPCTVGTQEPPWPSTGGNHRCRRYIPFFPQHRCLAQTHEPHRSSTGIITPVLGAAAVLSFCRHLTTSYVCASPRPTFAFHFPQQCCLAQTQEPHRSSTGTNIPSHIATAVYLSVVISQFHSRERIALDAKALRKTKALRMRRR